MGSQIQISEKKTTCILEYIFDVKSTVEILGVSEHFSFLPCADRGGIAASYLLQVDGRFGLCVEDEVLFKETSLPCWHVCAKSTFLSFPK